jgi:hypothetical protein
LIRIADEQRIRLHSVVAWLQDSAQVLTLAEAAPLKLRLEIVISDDRSPHSLSLPAISEPDVSVPIRATFSKPLN